MWYLLSVFCVSFVYTFAKAFQQLNVAHDKFGWVIPVSLFMATCEVFLVTSIAFIHDASIIFPMGIGAGFGAIVGMLVHKRITN